VPPFKRKERNMTDTLTPEENKEMIKAFIATALKIEDPGPILILAKGKDRIANLIIGNRLELVGMIECFKHQLIRSGFGTPEIIEETKNDTPGSTQET
jgi:hypothetical protein